MTRDEKAKVVDNLAQAINESKHFYLADISSLNAEDTSNLRRKCYEKDIKLVAGAPVVTCPFCGTTYQLTEEPKW